MSEGKKRRSHAESRKERIDEFVEKSKAKKAEKAMKSRKESLKKAADKFKRKRHKKRTGYTPHRDLKAYDAEVVAQGEKENDRMPVGAPTKINPEIERVIFPYYISGASIRSIHQQFGTKFNFSLQSIYTARDFYKWEQRKNAIYKVARNSTDLEMVDRFKDYMSFFDDLISESMIRFSRNSSTGQNTNPFNTLKITSVKDLKDITELMMNVMNGGKKLVKIEGRVNHKLSDKKAGEILGILAAEDDKDEKGN